MPEYILSFAGRVGEIMPDITEEEAFALDELVTKNPPKVDPSKARHTDRIVILDDLSADYLLAVSVSTNKTPAEIISEMIREKTTPSK